MKQHLSTGLAASHKCKACGALWRYFPPTEVESFGSWNLRSAEPCGACDANSAWCVPLTVADAKEAFSDLGE